MQVVPAPCLSPFIKSYLFLETAADATFHFIPDGNTGVVFSSGKGLQIGHCPDESSHHRFVYGQQNRGRILRTSAQTRLAIVVFQPYGMNLLTGIPAFALCEKVFAADVVFPSGLADLHRTLGLTSTVAAKTELLNDYFAKLSRDCFEPASPEIVNVSDNILQSKGIYDCKLLEDVTGWSQRHIERRFHQQIGITPKRFANIVRINSFLKQLRDAPNSENIGGLAYDSGYYDQAHLNREFRRWSLATPSAYRDAMQPLALNLMRLG